MSILPTIVQLNEHEMELVQYHTLQHYFCPYLTASNNEFMSGPLDKQDIKGEMNAEAEHDAGSLPDRLINRDAYEPVVATHHRRIHSCSAHRLNQ